MSDETRSNYGKGRRRPRILLVNNPDPEGASSSDDEKLGQPTAYTRPHPYPRPLPSPSHATAMDRSQASSTSHMPAPLTTDIPEQRHCYPSSRSNPSNPALSSPSSTSSPAFESTPPPSTPGQSAPPVDLTEDGGVRHEAVALPAPDRNDTSAHCTSRPAKLFDKFKSHLPRHGHVRRSSNNSRPPSSPTTSTHEYSVSQPNYVLPKVLVFVSADADNFSIVDISGAMTPAFIRERIFSKLQISDEDHPRFSIYRTEVGKYALGDALTDEQLFDLCREQGDDKASLKLFVSPSSASVHEPLQDTMVISPTVNASPVIPPVLPQHNLYAPLRPLRRSRSRHGSQSSTSERLHPEVAAGYEASVSDDLEHADRETRRATIRPPPQTRLPSSSHRPPSPANGNRPPSPSDAPSVDRLRMQCSPEANATRSDVYRAINRAPAAPHSMSPQNSKFPDDHSSSPPQWDASPGPSPDTVTERETPIQAEYAEKRWRSPQDKEERDSSERERPRRKDPQLRRDPGYRHAKPLNHEPSESWTMVPSDLPSSGYRRDRPTTPQDTRSPSSRYGGASPGYGSSPKSHSGSRGASGESRPHGKRSTGKAVPTMWPVAWSLAGPGPGGKIEQKPIQSHNWSSRMMAKSMTDMRAAYKQQHPPSLQPGRPTRPTQHPLPVTNRPSTSGSATSGTSISHSTSATGEALSSAYHDSAHNGIGIPRSYDGQRGIVSPTGYHATRPTASTGYPTSQSVGTGYLGLTSPGQEPYPRPRSAVEEAASPPYSQQRLPQSSKSPETTPDSAIHRSAHVSPHHFSSTAVASHTSLIREDRSPSGPLRPIALAHAEQHSNISSAPDVTTQSSCTHSPPRSPVGLAIAQNENGGKGTASEPQTMPIKRDSFSQSATNRGVLQESDDSESTFRREEHAWMAGFIDENAMEGTAKPRAKVMTSQVPPPPPPPPGSYGFPSATLVDRSHCRDDEESDSDDGGTGIWAVPPGKNGKNSQSSWQRPIIEKSSNVNRPPLPPLSIENSSSSRPLPLPVHSSFGASQVPSANFPAPPDSIPPPPPLRTSRRQPTSAPSKNVQDQRTSRFDNNFDYTWAPRPPPEDVYEKLEEYFPEHDLDRPLIDAPSGGNSPTSAEHPVAMPMRFKHKKSIRVVAAEHKNRSRNESSSVANALRKRNTKLWGSRLEEVTTEQAKSELSSVVQDPSPGGIAKPIFRWVRGELIGKGTYGKVYLALNATTGEMIAVKQVEIPRTASDKDDTRQVSVVEALKLESETLKDLDHSNIVQYLGFEETPTFLSIFLEYVPGGSIASCLRKHGRFDEEVTKSFTGQILSGLEYLHSRGILHRDLKADNILVETSGVCKISDFGISKRTDDINIAGAYTSMQGTVFWMAPEVIHSQERGYNSKIDIWSVGCVVFEMWTGQRPWSGQEAMAVLLHLYKTKEGPPVPSEVTLTSLADDFRQKCFAM
ncbi:hypothetical protein AcW2_000643 [Taiwanofungus camphoratus]|nr:hypothetical protein AcW2_000643 [Antrodia cinnamomea]